ncbi:MAG: alpha/beta hydrolase-fold protein [Polyangiaceae bacterium]
MHRRPVPLLCPLLLAVPLSCSPAPSPPPAVAVTPPTPSSSATASPPAPSPLRFSVSFPSSLSATSIDGRLLVVLAKSDAEEPRKQISDRDGTAQVFGIDVDALGPGQAAIIDGGALGYPIASLDAVPAGDYFVEAVLHRYETFKRGDGHTVKLPPDRGEGQDWRKAPGNLVSVPRKIHIDARAPGGEQRIELAQALPELPPVPDTKYVKHIVLQSERLTKFWGRPTFLGAIVVVPEGWDTHPNAHYPVVINHGHFEREPGWREKPADPALPAADLEGIRRHCPNGHEGKECTKYGYERFTQETEYAFFQKWTGKGFPRVLDVTIQHANPYYDDSYAVNSENVGPYGDAITYELVPYIEKTFRGLGPWARGMMGGSTGGWESLAAQVFYPEEYNGAIANCPDPIDFDEYTTIDIYKDTNAYYSEGPFRRTPRPAERDYLGATRATVEQQNVEELVLGTHSRSGGQWDIWQAVYSPVGDDGYPKPIWDKRTGVIDPSVAAYWKEHYDLGHILSRDWPRLAPLLRGKITLNVGLSDNFFLNDAVYLVDDFLRTAKPPADAHVDYGARDEHCWSGDHTVVNAVSRLTYAERFVPKLVEHWLKTAPKGADVKSWRY